MDSAAAFFWGKYMAQCRRAQNTAGGCYRPIENGSSGGYWTVRKLPLRYERLQQMSPDLYGAFA
jgi:hypothetical protein